jgi:hypothetical protein
MPTPKDFSPFVPFDLYDFFGYIFPGVLFSVSMLLFYDQLHPAFYKDWFLQNSNSREIPFILGLGIVVASIVILYAMGHVIATLSHIIVDRVLIDGIEGYPVNFLLDLPQKDREYSEATFKYLFAFFNVLVLLPSLPVSYSVVFYGAISLTAVIVILVIQRIIVMLIHLRKHGREITRRYGDKKFFRALLRPSQLLIDPGIQFLRKLLGMDRRFSDQFIKTFKKIFDSRFRGLKSQDEGSENYWLTAFASASGDEVHDRTITTWLHLYGFARNACAALYLSSILILCHIMFNEGAFTGLVPLQIGLQWFLAAILGIRYWILYSHYFTKGVIRAFVELQTRPVTK